MPRLGYADTVGLWQAAGGDPAWAPLMAGVAYGESRWDTTAWANRPETLDNSVGLWQINYYGSLAPSRTQRYGPPEELQADPLAQARAAVDIFGDNGAGIGAWANNPVVKLWKAAGSPQKPDVSTVGSWIAQLGGDVTAPSSPDAGPGVAGASGLGIQGRVEVAPGVNVVGGKKVGCSEGSKGVTLSLPVVGDVASIGNACQLKALQGGLLVGVGASLLVAGAILLVAGTRAFQTAAGVAGAAVGGPGGGALASGAAGALGGLGRSSGASRAVSGARSGVRRARADRSAAEEEALFDEVLSGIAEARRNPSPARRQYERERPARRRAAERAADTSGEPF